MDDNSQNHPLPPGWERRSYENINQYIYLHRATDYSQLKFPTQTDCENRREDAARWQLMLQQALQRKLELDLRHEETLRQQEEYTAEIKKNEQANKGNALYVYGGESNEASRGSSSVSSVSLTFSSSSAKVLGDHNFSNMHTCHGLCDHNDATTTGKLSIEAQYEGGSGKCNVSITHVEPNNSLLHLVHLASITDRQAKKRRVSASSTTSHRHLLNSILLRHTSN